MMSLSCTIWQWWSRRLRATAPARCVWATASSCGAGGVGGAMGGNCTCAMRVGDCFFMRGGKIALPDGHDFCLYALQAAIPLLPAKQRQNHPADWMETDARVTRPR